MEDLIVTLPLMKPRHYSISSASEVQPRQIRLTVGVLKVTRMENDNGWLFRTIIALASWRGGRGGVGRRSQGEKLKRVIVFVLYFCGVFGGGGGRSSRKMTSSFDR